MLTIHFVSQEIFCVEQILLTELKYIIFVIMYFQFDSYVLLCFFFFAIEYFKLCYHRFVTPTLNLGLGKST